jgi:hypothetical protein
LPVTDRLPNSIPTREAGFAYLVFPRRLAEIYAQFVRHTCESSVIGSTKRVKWCIEAVRFYPEPAHERDGTGEAAL